jgi:DNA-binding HxlR family transcriptional regulator
MLSGRAVLPVLTSVPWVPYHDGRRARHEYRLTQAGADLAPILRALGDWGHRHTEAAVPSEPIR